MGKIREYVFDAKIYKVLTNSCIDVPIIITDTMISQISQDEYIRVKGKINGIGFHKKLVPVKNYPYRLFVDIWMLKRAGVKIGEKARFVVQQDLEIPVRLRASH
ncbi:uncharacterized protein DUF1905 [Gillisia sp. Hel_I_86]|uniref:DUF1905 domain-containing protein n=1 Tax=Gillisia sp. Hel_I_86 TaxID=1249981 RepID=UPI0011997D8E|nr:DUF1905 domain-containing protein [Gillisia sp. Hel_I_86]TVZ25861.1 uncharacterized protein DUF1905 [Gillisia sp. Hel_I_86]